VALLGIEHYRGMTVATVVAELLLADGLACRAFYSAGLVPRSLCRCPAIFAPVLEPGRPESFGIAAA